MQFFIILALSSYCLVAALSEEEIKQEWLNFNEKYSKSYRSTDTNIKCYQNFEENLKKIDEHNKRFEQKLSTYKMAVNPFTDINLKELQSTYMGLKINEMEKQSFLSVPKFRARTATNNELPSFMDWRERGVITPVKNQRSCGSCWAFSSTGALEAHHFLKHNKTVLLSEQNLVDCVKESHGCQGGFMSYSFDYVKTNGGINDESTYPYEAVNGECRFQSKNIAATCDGYNMIRQGDEQHLLEIVATKGPVSVSIAVNSNFQNYVEGIYNDPECSKSVNHGVLVVGFGTENGQDYWLVKNSWGSDWGDKGYIKMARNKDNQCAIASYALYPLV